MPRITLKHWKGAGCVVPVFSLRSEGSMGVGDFGDLRKMVRWASETGMKAVQLLPINDTTRSGSWHDSYPYNGISVFALHPLYLDLREWRDTKAFKAVKEEGTKLNALPALDYEQTFKLKMTFAHALYKECGAKICMTPDYKVFVNDNTHWLPAYTAFSALRDFYHTADFRSWPQNCTFSNIEQIEEAHPELTTTRAFYAWLQFLLHRQMLCVHNEARALGVILKGDIPIGISCDSVPAWVDGHLFHFNGQAGAPPDAFATHGQNWGFPTYNWDEMLKDDCAWWVRRFQNMSKFFDAYRIDHVLGFFRIWDIPIDSVHGLLGQFSPSLAMSREEIEAYGLRFQEDHFTRPFITDWILDRIFHERAEEVRRRYLNHAHDDVYNLKPEYDSQRKIEAVFEAEHQAMVANKADQAALQAHNNLRDGLYALVSNVLFIRDRKDANKFHPRISAQLDFTYEALYDCDKAVFNRLYNDYYYHRNNQFWYREAMKKLPKLVQATRMLVCAEDLGMVPDCVPWVMDELKILSLELQSMPKDPTVRFGHLSRNPYRSVCTISSHDMPTLRQWWDENIERTQSYYNTMLYRSGGAPHPLPGWLARDIIYRHLASPSMLCVLSIQDWLAISERLRLADQNAERINIPANPKHYWRYRMHLNIEDLISDQEFTGEISGMLNESGRRQ